MKFNQKIDALKRIISPQLDYEMLNGVCPQKELKALGAHIRGQIQASLNHLGLQIKFVYT